MNEENNNFQGIGPVCGANPLRAGNFVQLNVNSVDAAEHNDGYNIVVVDETSGAVLDSDSFDPDYSAADADAMAAYLNNIAPGRIVLVGIKDNGGWQNMSEAAYVALESIGSALIRNVRTNDSWGIIGIKGAPIGSVTEKHVDDDEASIQTMPGTIFLAPYYVDGYKFYYQDHLGSTRQLSSSDVKIDYYPYGMELNSAGTETDYKFAGKERDLATGLDYLGARYLMSRIGRFGVPDPLASKYPLLSPYVYSANNPIKFIDSDGRDIKNASQNYYVVWCAWHGTGKNFKNEGAGILGPGESGGGTVHDFMAVYGEEDGSMEQQIGWAKTTPGEAWGTWTLNNDKKISVGLFGMPWIGETIPVETFGDYRKKGIMENNIKVLSAELGKIKTGLQGEIAGLKQEIEGSKDKKQKSDLSTKLKHTHKKLEVVDLIITEIKKNKKKEKENGEDQTRE